VAGLHARAMPVPEVLRPLKQIVIDRTTSEALLTKGMYIRDEESGTGYGLLDAWIPRLGYYTVRRSGADALTGDALVVICPSKPVDDQFREGLMDYVAEGGRLLVIDSPENTASTANSLLWPFGLSLEHGRPRRGTLTLAGSWPNIEVQAACEVSGGTALARFRDMPVAAAARHGEGVVVAIGFGSIFNDAGMGLRWDVEPQPAVKTRFDTLFALLRYVVEDTPFSAATASAAKP